MMQKTAISGLIRLHNRLRCTGAHGGLKTAQSLWHHDFATVHHRDMWFSA